MNDDLQAERKAISLLTGAAPSRAPASLLVDTLSSVGRTRQRTRWLAYLKEPPMRYRSQLVVGSPTLRLTAALAVAAVLLVALAGAVVAGASLLPSPAPSAPSLPSFFTGNAPVSSACQLASPATQVVDGAVQMRGERWGCLKWTTDDPRFSGVSTNIYNTDEYLDPAQTATGRVGKIVAGRERIVNDAGAWEGTWTDLEVESFHEVAGWFVGEDAYEGLTAYVVITDAMDSAKVWGFISPSGELKAPEAIPQR